jgi:hypothetical protein
MLAILVGVALLVTVIVGLAYKRKSYWKDRGAKGPEPALFWGNLDVLGNPVETQQGPIYYQ